MNQRLVRGLWLVLLAALALGLRLPRLAERPLHGDESVHCQKLWTLYSEHRYEYDPHEYHGPTLYYATLPIFWLRQPASYAATREVDYRLAPVVFGVVLVLLPALLVDGLGWPAALAAGLLTALSPALVYYSRYYIQETLFACFTLALIGAGWRYQRTARPGWLVAAGCAAGLMLATKETCLASFAALGLAAVAWRGRPAEPRLPGLWDVRRLAAAGCVALVTAAVLLSGFFTHPAGALGYLQTFTPWLERAGGTNLHRHEWSYYLSLLAWTHRSRGPVFTEALVLGLAGVGALGALRPAWLPRGASRRLVGVLALYTVLLTAIYSAIPYKTPWCVLTFLDGFVLLAGVGAAALVERAPGRLGRVAVVALLLAGCWHLGRLAWRASTDYATDARNPYAYAHTGPDVFDIEQRVNELLALDPRLVVKVVWTDDYYWPLPWYLRRVPDGRVGYYNQLPTDPLAPVVLAAATYTEAIERRLGATHEHTGTYGLRRKVPCELWVEKGLWERYMARRR
jgi:uncharacterized protein (TIGR03663 family)